VTGSLGEKSLGTEYSGALVTLLTATHTPMGPIGSAVAVAVLAGSSTLRFIRAASLYSTRALPDTSPRLLFLFSNLIVAVSFSVFSISLTLFPFISSCS